METIDLDDSFMDGIPIQASLTCKGSKVITPII